MPSEPERSPPQPPKLQRKIGEGQQMSHQAGGQELSARPCRLRPSLPRFDASVRPTGASKPPFRCTGWNGPQRRWRTDFNSGPPRSFDVTCFVIARMPGQWTK